MAQVFPPFADRRRFPILNTGRDDPDLQLALMSCDSLVAIAPENVDRADFIGRSAGMEWHEYGDARWPGRACWVEFPVTNLQNYQLAGSLVLRHEIPSSFHDPLEWAGFNHPMALFSEALRTETGCQRFAAALHRAAKSPETIPGPADTAPRYIQSYILFGKSLKEPEHDEIADYTDLLNEDGVPIARYRTAEFQIKNIPWCRSALNALFHLNRARIDGHAFVIHRQHPDFAPKLLNGDQPHAKWTAFHPCRMLRLRPAVRGIPSPAIFDGLIKMEALEIVTEARRLESNRELVAFERECRPRDLAHQNLDSNSTVAAFVHRANGAAIYILPPPLVDEFDKTDCSEVRMADFAFPFFNLYLKFVPPDPIELGQCAVVDGCYVVKQGDEILLKLTSTRQDVDYENSFAITCLDPVFALHLPCSNPEISINDAIQLGIAAFLRDNAPPTEDLSQVVQLPDGSTKEIVDVRATSRKRRIAQFESQEPAFRSCLNIIVNAACFVSFRPDDVEEAWQGTPPNDMIAATTAAGETRTAHERKTAALRKIENGDFTRVRICGRKLFDSDLTAGAETGRSVRAHWRRGHWRRQRQGPGLIQIHLRWIRPTLVKKEAGAPVEGRLYEP